MAISKRQEKDEEDRKIFDKIFDKLAVKDLFKLKAQKYFDTYHRIWKEGKESKILIVYKDNSPRILKIYKIEAGGFKNMIHYLKGDPRFKKINNGKRKIIYEWCKKEFHNLQIANRVGVNAPTPYAYLHNIIVMELLGDIEPYPQLKEIKLTHPEKMLKEIIKGIRNLLEKGNLVHGDISEFNILVDNKEKPYFIDFAQGILKSHPYAEKFLKRDITNIINYFNKEYHINVDIEEIFENITKGVFNE